MLRRYTNNVRFWHRLSVISWIFSLLICVLIIANYIQSRHLVPLETDMIDNMIEQLHQDPKNDVLREEIRLLDLLTRKAYFTQQWQIRMGGYLLLAGIAMAIIALQIVIYQRKPYPKPGDESRKDLILLQKKSRQWIAGGGVLLVLITFILALLTHRDLETSFNQHVSDLTQGDSVSVISADDSMESEISKDSIQNDVLAKDTANQVIKEEVDTVPVEDTAEGLQFGNVENPDDYFANFRGPGGYGLVTQKNIPIDWDGESGTNILWKTKIPLRGFNTPIIWGNKLFLTGADENVRQVYALDKNSGSIHWIYEVKDVEGSPEKSPEVANYTGYAAPSMATNGNLVLAVFANGDLVALDMAGNLAWSRNLGIPENHYGHSSSLICEKDRLFIQYDQRNMAKVMAINTTNGNIIWEVKREVKISWSSPILVNYQGESILILAADPYVIAYAASNGKEKWKAKCISGEVGPSPAYSDGLIYTVNDYSVLSAIRLADGNIKWENEEYLSDVPSPVAKDQYLIAPTSYGTVACLNAETGSLFWEEDLDNTIYASPMIVEGNVYLVDKTGVTHIFKLSDSFELISKPELGERVVCTPAFSDGRIYIRGFDNVYCIGTK